MERDDIIVSQDSPLKIKACHAGEYANSLWPDALEASAVQSLEAAGHSCQVDPEPDC